MSFAQSNTASQEIQYQYNKVGNMRAPMSADGLTEVLLDVKLVPHNYATSDYLASLGGPVAEARNAGFVLSFQPADVLGIETLNEVTGQWRAVPSSSTYAVVAALPA